MALGELIARYSPGLRAYLRKMTGPAADDLLQETWLEVYRKISRLQRPQAFVTWLYRIARDMAYREGRRHRSMPAFEDKAWEDEEDAGFSPEELAGVRVALDELPFEQREVLVLRFMEDMSYEQIAEVIARPVGTVRSRIYYAKLALRAKLELIRKDLT